MNIDENAMAIADYVSTTTDRQLPPDIIDAAKMCFADWLAVGLGAHDQAAGCVSREVALSWSSQGRSPVFWGGLQGPMASALVNGVFAHCLDYDDTHLGCLAHLSGPTWAATLAMASHLEKGDHETLKAFVAGFEVGARIGGEGLGESVNKRGIHSTAVFGRFAATAATASLMGLNGKQVANAMGVAATQAGGLVASFGTMSKPFHAGKAAMDGILSAELAAKGFQSKPDLLETEGDGLAAVLVQDHSVGVQPLDFNTDWEILKNTFKPYAACLLTHPTIESARDLAEKVANRKIAAVRARVNPMVLRFAAKSDPQAPLEGKFSTAYCAAVGLSGYRGSEQDFSEERIADPAVREIMQKVELIADESMASTAASLTVGFEDGDELVANTALATGNPGNPLGWGGMEWKFMSLVEPVIGAQAKTLFELVRECGNGGTLKQIVEIVSTTPRIH